MTEKIDTICNRCIHVCKSVPDPFYWTCSKNPQVIEAEWTCPVFGTYGGKYSNDICAEKNKGQCEDYQSRMSSRSA